MDEYVNIVIPPLKNPFTYKVAQTLLGQVSVGDQVEVTLGRRKALGYVISSASNEAVSQLNFEIKSVERSAHWGPCFLESQLRFFQWVADYYGESLAEVIDCATPPKVNPKTSRSILITKNEQHSIKVKGKQQQILKFLAEQTGEVDWKELLRKIPRCGPSLNKLAELGFVEIKETEVAASTGLRNPAPVWAKGEVTLTETQEKCLGFIQKHIQDSSFSPMVLHGITGSGKTEVYIEAIRYAQSLNMGTLTIVPEIALTPQLIDRYQARLGNNISILHSALQKRVRWEAWQALLKGQSFVAIGARSAIFAPVHRLGLIIVDEEHDSSFKQAEGLRYQARDLAILRAKLESCPVILGSATPSLESFHHCLTKRYHFLSLPARPQASNVNEIQLIDLNKIKRKLMPSPNVTPALQEAIANTLARGEQAFVLYNRRGFASYLGCPECEYVVGCPNCSVTLTYHQQLNALVCHYCSLQIVPPLYCPQCSQAKPPALQQRGAGTEKIFEELHSLFPEARLDRLDRDAASDEATYRSILERIRSGETNILVGTQMIAKGHDIPNVTFVGIVDCDVGLHMPDFRASERVFQLLTQAAGRSGRGEKPGLVLLQTRVPNNPSLVHTLTKDFKGFAQRELATRKILGYPPFQRMLRIVAAAPEPEIPVQILVQLKQLAEENFPQETSNLKILGPTAAPIQKLKTLWRAHLLLKSTSAKQLLQVSQLLKSRLRVPKNVRMVFDIDPQDMM